MNTQIKINQFFESIPAFDEWKSLWNTSKNFVLYGGSLSFKSLIISTLAEKEVKIIVCPDLESLEKWREDLQTWLPEAQILNFPNSDWFRFSTIGKGLEIEMQRMHVLNELSKPDSSAYILTSAEAIIEPVLLPEELKNSQKTISINDQLSMNELIEWLVDAGYERTDQVDEKGLFSVRGGIIDLFSPDEEIPYRIEWFGDEVETLRTFSIENQRTIGEKKEIQLLPLRESSTKEKGTFFEYFSETSWIVFDDPTRCREVIQDYRNQNEEFSQQMLDWKKVIEKTNLFQKLFFSLLMRKISNFEKPLIPLGFRENNLISYQHQLENFIPDLKLWAQQKRKILIWMGTIEKADSLKTQLLKEDIPISDSFDLWKDGTVLIQEGWIQNGYEFTQANVIVLTERQLFGKGKKPRRQVLQKKKSGIKHFRDIHAGDYVVHGIHGIGRYMGVETITVEGIQKDYLLIRYAGEDKLYLPPEQVGILQKYIGNDGEAPRIHKLGGNEWNRIKEKARASAKDLAKELIKIYAQRKKTEGFSFEKDTSWQTEFEDSFPYEETEDQLRTIEEIKTDMENSMPMDRLVCGDVGFGKTEVAIRAAFKAVMNAKQVAVLVPTTVLAYQHYQTFTQRFAGYGPTVEMISRYRTAKERKKILERVKNNQIDVLIGTHSILQKGIEFKDIGLLIIDEEQRFGVTQKEKWKSWKPNVDILSLSATPIPRTLHMSLTGLRDMSIIDTAPLERRPVQTYVMEKKPDLIQEAIERELRRGGQCYVIYNRVQGLDKFVAEIKELVPEANVAMAHGRMTEAQMEDVIQGFYEGEYDVLVSTSIVENGLDVPNANTILVYDADKLGLSQLYQMRGRVGRARRQAYAYFLYEPEKMLTEVAEKRLRTLLEYTELGAGFKIAMRDLEIRGAGNLLGSQQHGQIASVGFEMYCQLIEEAIHELDGNENESPLKVVGEDTTIDISVDAHIPSNYISEPLHKMEVYQRIMNIPDESEIKEYRAEIIDRFGPIPKELDTLLLIALIRLEARKIGIRSITQKGSEVELIFGSNGEIYPEKWVKWHGKYSRSLRLLKRKDDTVLKIKTIELPKDVLYFLLDLIQDFQKKD